MKRSGIGVLAVLGVVFALGVASCGGTSSKTPSGNSEAGAPGEAVGGEPTQAAAGSGVGASNNEGGSGGTGGTLNLPGAAGEPSYAEGGFYGVAGAPSDEQCVPGQLSCDGPSVRECDEDGAGTTIVETCGLSETCVAGSCEDIACAPRERACRDGQVVQCNDLGTDFEPIKTCKADEYCIEQDGSALCSPTVCVASEPLCINQVATTCKADGSGPVPGGQNCANEGRSCHEGECVVPTCTPGEKLCQGGDVYICIGGGVDAVLFSECAKEEICDPGLAACREVVCEPGKLGCDDTRVVTCDSLGLGWQQTGPDCASSDQICVSGGCKTPTCVPSSTFCKDTDVYACDEHGVASSLHEACADAWYHCVPHYYYPNQAYCGSNSCTPGQPICNGKVLTTCNSEGSGLNPGGSDCGTGNTCSNGACVAKLCEPYQSLCQNGDVHYCSADGASAYVSSYCGIDAECAVVDGYATCRTHSCTPGIKACLANQLGTCGGDGQSLSTVKQDCASSEEVCTSSSTCAASALDTLGAAEELLSLGTDQVMGDVVDVLSHRQLVELEANVILPGARNLRWVVYEQVGSDFEIRYEKLALDQSGSGYLSSGPISYTLKAGHRYYLGLAVSGGGFVSYYDATPWQPDVSFGRARGSLVTLYATSFFGYYLNTNQLFDLRFTTQLP